MGELRELNGRRSCILESEHLIGRGPQCALKLGPNYVSAQHAVIRWNGRAWELLDRGSRNGTQLNGTRIDSGRPYPLAEGAILAFGHPEERWVLSDATDPQVMLLGLQTGTKLLAIDGVIGVPSNQDPQCTIFRGSDGSWTLEYPDQAAVVLQDGATFELAQQVWRFCCPTTAAQATAVVGGGQASPASLHFSVSMDEEFVELCVERADRKLSLGCRAHNYLLLVLARARLADVTAHIPDSACGWMYKEDLAKGLSFTPEQVDGEVFRIRKHFAQHGLDEAAVVIERRPRTKQLRLGIPRVQITRI